MKVSRYLKVSLPRFWAKEGSSKERSRMAFPNDSGARFPAFGSPSVLFLQNLNPAFIIGAFGSIKRALAFNPLTGTPQIHSSNNWQVQAISVCF